MKFFEIFSSIRIQDLIDIFFLTLVTYHLYLWFRGTKAFKALIGLMVLGVIFTIAQTWGLWNRHYQNQPNGNQILFYPQITDISFMFFLDPRHYF
jgi:hypothetical protein